MEEGVLARSIKPCRYRVTRATTCRKAFRCRTTARIAFWISARSRRCRMSRTAASIWRVERPLETRKSMCSWSMRMSFDIRVTYLGRLLLRRRSGSSERSNQRAGWLARRATGRWRIMSESWRSQTSATTTRRFERRDESSCRLEAQSRPRRPQPPKGPQTRRAVRSN